MMLEAAHSLNSRHVRSGDGRQRGPGGSGDVAERGRREWRSAGSERPRPRQGRRSETETGCGSVKRTLSRFVASICESRALGLTSDVRPSSPKHCPNSSHGYCGAVCKGRPVQENGVSALNAQIVLGQPPPGCIGLELQVLRADFAKGSGLGSYANIQKIGHAVLSCVGSTEDLQAWNDGTFPMLPITSVTCNGGTIDITDAGGATGHCTFVIDPARLGAKLAERHTVSLVDVSERRTVGQTEVRSCWHLRSERPAKGLRTSGPANVSSCWPFLSIKNRSNVGATAQPTKPRVAAETVKRDELDSERFKAAYAAAAAAAQKSSSAAVAPSAQVVADCAQPKTDWHSSAALDFAPSRRRQLEVGLQPGMSSSVEPAVVMPVIDAERNVESNKQPVIEQEPVHSESNSEAASSEVAMVKPESIVYEEAAKRPVAVPCLSCAQVAAIKPFTTDPSPTFQAFDRIRGHLLLEPPPKGLEATLNLQVLRVATRDTIWTFGHGPPITANLEDAGSDGLLLHADGTGCFPPFPVGAKLCNGHQSLALVIKCTTIGVDSLMGHCFVRVDTEVGSRNLGEDLAHTALLLEKCERGPPLAVGEITIRARWANAVK